MCVQFIATAFAASSGRPVPQGGFTKKTARDYLATLRAGAARQQPDPNATTDSAGVVAPAGGGATSAPEADSGRGRRLRFMAGSAGLKI